MDFSRFMAIISSFALSVCLVLSITTLVVLRNAVEEDRQIQHEAKAMIDDLNTSVEKLEDTANTNSSLENNGQQEIPTNVKAEIFTLREYEGKIAVYTEEGIMLHWVDVNTSLLPKSDRAALAEGIEVEGRHSLLSYLQDYMS